MTAAIYVNVADRQRREKELSKLRYFAWERDWKPVEYLDDADRGNPRAEFERLFLDAAARRFHIVLFWSLDRFIDEGPLETLDYLERLTRCGVGYCSASQHYLDTTGIFKGAVIDIVAAIASQKRTAVSVPPPRGTDEPGSPAARKPEQRGGRPRVAFDVDAAITLRRDGVSWREIGRKLGVGTTTIRRACREASTACQNPEGGVL